MVHVEAVSPLAGRNVMSLVRSVKKYRWVLALPWFIILLVYLLMQPQENQPGVDQVPGQCGSELKPVIFRDLYKRSMY